MRKQKTGSQPALLESFYLLRIWQPRDHRVEGLLATSHEGRWAIPTK